MAARGLVDAPPLVPLTGGLFSALGLRGAGDRWEGIDGVAWETVPCGPVLGRGPDICDPQLIDPEVPESGLEQPIGIPKTLDGTANATGEATPFTVYGTFQCNPMGWAPERAQDRATQKLIAREEARVEQALWTGDLGTVPNFSGANDFAAPDVLTPTDTTLLGVIAELEQHLAEEYGGQGVLHMSRRVATYAADKAGVKMQGGRLQTALGTPVVAGAGYASDRIVATGGLFGYRSDIFTSSNTRGDLMNRGTNTLTAVSERSYLIGFDTCGFAAAAITI